MKQDINLQWSYIIQSLNECTLNVYLGLNTTLNLIYAKTCRGPKRKENYILNFRLHSCLSLLRLVGMS